MLAFRTRILFSRRTFQAAFWENLVMLCFAVASCELLGGASATRLRERSLLVGPVELLAELLPDGVVLSYTKLGPQESHP